MPKDLHAKAVIALCLVFLGAAPLRAEPGPATPERPAPGQRPVFARQTNAPAPRETSEYRHEVLASGLAHPWAIAFLPDGRMLVTERAGTMRIVEEYGRVSEPLDGVPDVRGGGTAGLLDIELDPDYATNGLVYFVYLEPRGEAAGIAVARARLDTEEDRLSDVTVIFRAEPAMTGNENAGARLVFGKDRLLYIALGDRFSPDTAQSPSGHLGKIVRIAPDGSIPAGNPFADMPGIRPEIYALGFRNPEGLAMEPGSGALWELENGAKGGDELNLVVPGGNYGWPIISYGRGYDDAKLGVGTARAGLLQPVYYWDPSIAPSGFTFYNGDLFPDWKGNIFVAALKGRHVSRLVIQDRRVVAEEQMLGKLKARIRTVAEGPDGALYVLTDEAQGRLVRVLPAELLTRN